VPNSDKIRFASRIAIIVIAAAALGHAAAYFYVTSDDALISLRYAQNIALGHGAVYNPGAPAVEGFSNPVFTAIAAIAIRMGVAPIIAAKGIGVFSLLALVGVVAPLVRAIDGRGSSRIAAYAPVAALLLATSSFAVFWSVAGLETVLHALFVTAAVGLTMRETERGRVFLSPLAWLLVAASRPEGAFIGAFAFVTQWLLLGLRPAIAIRWTALFGLPALALVGLRYAYYGALVPNTFIAKVSFGENSTYWGLQQLGGFAREGGYWLLIPALWFTVARLRTSGLSNTWLVALSVLVGQAIFVVAVGGDFMPAYRFVIPAYPLLCALAAAGFAMLERFSRPLALGLVAFATIGIPYSQSQALSAHPLRFWLAAERPWHAYLDKASFEGTWLQAHESVGNFIRLRSHQGDRLAVTEAGAIPFFAGIETIDMLGLNHREIALLWQRASRAAAADRLLESQADTPRFPGEPGSLAMHNYDVPSYVFKQRPRWIVIDGSYTADRGDFVPRLPVARTIVQSLQFGAYRKVFEAKVYDGAALGLGPNRIDVVFELRGSRRRRPTN